MKKKKQKVIQSYKMCQKMLPKRPKLSWVLPKSGISRHYSLSWQNSLQFYKYFTQDRNFLHQHCRHIGAFFHLWWQMACYMRPMTHDNGHLTPDMWHAKPEHFSIVPPPQFAIFCPFWFQFYYQHTLSDTVSPVCRIFGNWYEVSV